ncbi:MAG TPA: DegT/DnrJ/EryC1/StrS family aminotransferase [Gemmatimonadaceae bacterium]|nr:DegT/DnrJ/EryC1/StrS family aminotransferase [Gemmatimonadaceae bacterium]
MPGRFIPVAEPALAGNERKYVLDCLDTNWVSSRGQYIDRFERAFAEFCGASHAVSCTNGTVALHLALLALGIKPGDEIIVPTLTFVATANAAMYCGATPVFVDIEPATWNIDPARIEERITPRTRAIIVVHLYGHAVDMDAVMAIARKHKLYVIEDAAEATGATYKGKVVGSMGDLSTFSFFGNKVISTGEGGMVTTNDPAIAALVRQLKEQGMDPNRRYWFPLVGYNYRMTNIEAAIGLAQLEMIDWHMARRIELAAWYREELEGQPGLSWQVVQPWARHVYQFVTVVVDPSLGVERADIIAHMHTRGVEGRPVVFPMHELPPFAGLAQGQTFPHAEHVSRHGINLPTSASLTRDEVKRVCESLLERLAPVSTAR